MSGRSIWMDSGAFSSFTLGEKQDINAYCYFLERWKDYIDYAAVLDAIGDPDMTWDNQMYMEGRGVMPVPCFHFGEDPKWLRRYVERYDYVAIGGMVPVARPELMRWLDEIWGEHLTDRDGWPLVKVHGFGLTAFDLMRRYPWFSVDSSGWLQKGGFGLVLLMDERGEVYTVNISERAANTGEKGRHYLTETPANQAAIRRMIHAAGFTLEELMTHHEPRRILSAFIYSAFVDKFCALRPFQYSGSFNFLANVTKPARRMAVHKKMELYLAGDVTLACESRLWSANMNRMFTYHLLKKKIGRNFAACCAARDGKPFPPVEVYQYEAKP